MSTLTKNKYGFIAIGVIILLLFLWQEDKEKSLIENEITTVGIITEIEHCGGRTSKKCIKFSYLVDDKWIEGSDPLSASYPNYVRHGKPIVGGSYEVVYDATHPSFSKILIKPKPLSKEEKGRFTKLRFK